MTSIDVDEQIFNKDLSSYLLKNNICISNIHPLIISLIIAVCGGICLTEENNVNEINFSLKRMHRESSILEPIIEYLTNKEESHSVKVQTSSNAMRVFFNNPHHRILRSIWLIGLLL
jgi:hypothetical protein